MMVGVIITYACCSCNCDVSNRQHCGILPLTFILKSPKMNDMLWQMKEDYNADNEMVEFVGIHDASMGCYSGTIR